MALILLFCRLNAVKAPILSVNAVDAGILSLNTVNAVIYSVKHRQYRSFFWCSSVNTAILSTNTVNARNFLIEKAVNAANF